MQIQIQLQLQIDVWAWENGLATVAEQKKSGNKFAQFTENPPKAG